MTDDDLWFMPQRDAAPPEALPWSRADRQAVQDPLDWARAEGLLARELAEVALLFGILDERLRQGPAGWRHRLALTQAAELSWWAGDRIGPERLALWSALRLAGTQQDVQALARAGWALRRLEAGGALDSGSDTAISEFLGRQSTGADAGAFDLADLSRGLMHLHPVTRAAALFYGWRSLGAPDAPFGGDAVRGIEAAVVAARVAAEMGRAGQGAVFLPLGLTSQISGPVPDRLALWLRGAAQGTQAALRHLDQVAGWTLQAQAALAHLQGRTPGTLVCVLAEWPMVTAPLAEQVTRASRASVQRNLALMQGLGLIREVTGQGRYRCWAARL